MEFNQKLQELRKQKNLTQEELATALFVSRTAISKWESGRGYPNIESLKAIADFFNVKIDKLLSSDELLSIAQEDASKTEKRIRDLVFGLLDISCSMFLFVPFFAEKSNQQILTVSLLYLTDVAPYLKMLFYFTIIAIIVIGVLTFALQNFEKEFWVKSKHKISLALNFITALLFIISLQPYPAIYSLILLTIKVLLLTKKH